MKINGKKRAYIVLALILCLCLSGVPRADAVELPAATVAPEQNGMYDLLSQVFDSYHAGTAGSSLKAAYLAASMVDWACEHGQTAARAAALAWDRGTETEFGEAFSEKLETMLYSALRICRGGEGILADCGYQGTWTHTEAEVRETFENLFLGLGMTVPPDLRIGPAPMSTADHGVSVTFDHESEEARAAGAEILRAYIEEHFADVPVVFTADMNATADETAYATMTANLQDAALVADKAVTYGTFHGCSPETHADYTIDYILCSPDIHVKSFRVVTKGVDGRFTSDHFPLYADLVLPNCLTAAVDSICNNN